MNFSDDDVLAVLDAIAREGADGPPSLYASFFEGRGVSGEEAQYNRRALAHGISMALTFDNIHLDLVSNRRAIDRSKALSQARECTEKLIKLLNDPDLKLSSGLLRHMTRPDDPDTRTIKHMLRRVKWAAYRESKRLSASGLSDNAPFDKSDRPGVINPLPTRSPLLVQNLASTFEKHIGLPAEAVGYVDREPFGPFFEFVRVVYKIAGLKQMKPESIKRALDRAQ